jgi:hypothetical protein
MAVLKDFKCLEHGFFESTEPICPEGCTDGIHVVFLQAPAMLGDKTKTADSTLDGLAEQFKMSDIKSARAGESQAGYLTKNNKFSEKEYAEAQAHLQGKVEREPRPGDSAIWGQGFNNLNMANILSGRAVQSVRGESVGMSPSQAGITRGPTIDPRSTFKDPDNLTIKK